MKIRSKNLCAILLIAILNVSCSDSKEYAMAMCALIDISGTYATEKPAVVNMIKAGILPELMPGDSLFFITIDSNSYTEDNLKASLTLDFRPSEANSQKLKFASKLDEFAKDNVSAKHTDVSGAMMLCSDYLKDTKSGILSMLVFSDMREELPQGVVRNFQENEFENIHIAAMNVIKLKKDSADPELFRNRLADWENKSINSGAASWSTLVDQTKIPEFIQKLRD